MDLTVIKDKLVTDFINFLFIDLVEKYLQFKWNQKSKKTFLYHYLKISINYLQKNINLKNKLIIDEIKPMNKKEINQINSDLKKYPNYYDVFEKLNFIFNVIKNQNLQSNLFDYLVEKHILTDINYLNFQFDLKKNLFQPIFWDVKNYYSFIQ